MSDKIKITPALLESYFKGTCPEEQCYRVEQWLASKEQGDEDLAWLNVIFDGIDLRDNQLADKAFDRCASVLHLPAPDEDNRSRRTRRTLRSIVYPLIAAAIIAVGIPLGIHLSRNQDSVHLLEAYSPRGTSLNVQLPDGSEILLKGGSSLIYPERFSGDTREVWLTGECYASIAKNPDKPFVMTAGLINIRVTGTEFNVKSFPEDSEAEVALIKGGVILNSRRDAGSPVQTITMTPGRVVTIDKGNGETRINEFDADHYASASLENNAFFFLNQRFSDILSELGRRMDVDIILMDASLGQRRFYSSFVNGESLDEILSTFNADGSMCITSEGERTIKISKK